MRDLVVLTPRMYRRLKLLEAVDPHAKVVGFDFDSQTTAVPVVKLSDGKRKRVSASGRLLRMKDE